MRYYSTIKKKEILSCNRMYGTGGHYMKCNKPDTERHVFFHKAVLKKIKST